MMFGQSTKNTKKKVWLQMLRLGVKRQRHHVTSISRNSANPPAPKVARRFFLCMRELEALAIAIEL